MSGLTSEQHVARQQTALARAVQLRSAVNPSSIVARSRALLAPGAGFLCVVSTVNASAVPLRDPSSHLPAQGSSPAKDAGLRSCCRA